MEHVEDKYAMMKKQHNSRRTNEYANRRLYLMNLIRPIQYLFLGRNDGDERVMHHVKVAQLQSTYE